MRLRKNKLTRGRKRLTRGRKRLNVRRPKRGGGQNDNDVRNKAIAEYAAERKRMGLPELGTHSSLTELAKIKTDTLHTEFYKSISAIIAEEENLRECNTKLSFIETETFPQLIPWRNSLHMTMMKIIHSSDISNLKKLKNMLKAGNLTDDDDDDDDSIDQELQKWAKRFLLLNAGNLTDDYSIDQKLQKWAKEFLLKMVEEKMMEVEKRQQAMTDLEKIDKNVENIKNLEPQPHGLMPWHVAGGGFFDFGRKNPPMDNNAWKELIKQKLSSPNWSIPPQPDIYEKWIPDIIAAEKEKRGMGYKELIKKIDKYSRDHQGAYKSPLESADKWSIVDNLRKSNLDEDTKLKETRESVIECNINFEEMKKMVLQTPIFIIEKERLLAEFYEKKLKAQTTNETIDHWYEENVDKINNLEINDELKKNLLDELTKLVKKLKEGPNMRRGEN